jgi:hypothetical protein
LLNAGENHCSSAHERARKRLRQIAQVGENLIGAFRAICVVRCEAKIRHTESANDRHLLDFQCIWAQDRHALDT